MHYKISHAGIFTSVSIFLASCSSSAPTALNNSGLSNTGALPTQGSLGNAAPMTASATTENEHLGQPVNHKCLKKPLSTSKLLTSLRTQESGQNISVAGYDWYIGRNPMRPAAFKGPTLGTGQIQEPSGNFTISNNNKYSSLVSRAVCFPRQRCIVYHASGFINFGTARFDTTRNVEYVSTNEGVAAYQKHASTWYTWSMLHQFGTKNPPAYTVKSADHQVTASIGILFGEKGAGQNIFWGLAKYNGNPDTEAAQNYASSILGRILPANEIACLKSYPKSSRK
jgi:hypothetical protein